MSDDTNFVPRLDGTGSLGRTDKRWNEVHAKTYHGDGSSLTGISVDMGGTMTSHIIPDTNAQYDLGNAEYKIRHLFLSDNSLWVGDNHKIAIGDDGKMKFKKRNGVPLMLENAMTNAHGSVQAAFNFYVAQGVLVLDGRSAVQHNNVRLDELYLVADQLSVPHENLFRQEDMGYDFTDEGNDTTIAALQAQVDAIPDVSTAIAVEQTRAEAAEQANVNAIQTVNAALTQESSAREAADVLLQASIDTNAANIAAINVSNDWTDGTLPAGTDLNVDNGTLFVDASENKVGIGQTTPIAGLHIKIDAGGTTPQLLLEGGGASGGDLVVPDTHHMQIGHYSTTNGFTERMRLTSDGKLGINTTDPAATLDVDGTVTANGQVDFSHNVNLGGSYSTFVNGELVTSYRTVKTRGYSTFDKNATFSENVTVAGDLLVADNLTVGNEVLFDDPTYGLTTDYLKVREGLFLKADDASNTGAPLTIKANSDSAETGTLMKLIEDDSGDHWLIRYNTSGSSGSDPYGAGFGEQYWEYTYSNALAFLWYDSDTTNPSTYHKSGGYIVPNRVDTGISEEPFHPILNDPNVSFTGNHRCSPDGSETSEDFAQHNGKIVCATGEYNNFNFDEHKEKPNMNSSVCRIRLTDTSNQKSVLGVVAGIEVGNRVHRQGVFVSDLGTLEEGDSRVLVNSIGEGAVWVTNINGNLENGDYITTCEIPGYGMLQDDDLLHNYTVAKITMNCDFDLNSDKYECVEITHNGQTYKAAFVGCTYHCG